MKDVKISRVAKAKENQSFSSLALGSQSFSSKSSIAYSCNQDLKSRVINFGNLSKDHVKRSSISKFEASGCCSSIKNSNYSISELTDDFQMPCKISNSNYSISLKIENLFDKTKVSRVQSSNNTKNLSIKMGRSKQPKCSSQGGCKSIINLGPHPSFKEIKLECLQTSKMMDSNSVEFQLNLISELKKIKFSTKEVEQVKNPSAQSKSFSETSNNETVNNILNYARNTTILTTRSKSSQHKFKKSKNFCCCTSFKNSNKEINKSYLSTNITRKSGNYSVKSMVLNDSLSRFRKKKSASIKSEKKPGTCATACTIF